VPDIKIKIQTGKATGCSHLHIIMPRPKDNIEQINIKSKTYAQPTFPDKKVNRPEAGPRFRVITLSLRPGL
jgi:hypothetical protein